MSQHDFNIANQSFPATRTDLNNALQALASNSSGDAEPSTTFANQWWYETDTNTLKLRNEANNAWLSFATVDQTTADWTLAHDVIFGDNDKAIFGAGSDLQVYSDGTNGVLDSAGILTLDSAFSSGTTGGIIRLADAGTQFGDLYEDSGNFLIASASVDKDIIFKGNDAGGIITALTLDMSEGGNAIFNGNIVIGTAGKGIDFSVVTGGTGTATGNVLDDYEEGTFTVSFTGATITPANPTAIYTKIGSTVFWSWYSSGSTITGASGDAILSGLPFVVRNVQGAYSPFSTTHNTFFGGSATVGISGYHQKNGSNIVFITTGTTASSTYVNGTGKDLMICGTYLTDA
jgi:hypothetical protein